MNLFNRLLYVFKKHRFIRGIVGDLYNIQTVKNLDIIYKNYNSVSLNKFDTSSLDLGCGNAPRNPFDAKNVFGIDIRENANQKIKCIDLNIEKIPFLDNSFDYITAYDFLEHVPRILYTPNRRFPFVELMSEIYRVLKSGGIFLAYTPIFPFAGSYRDPTHVNIMTNETFSLYFDNKNNWAIIYGFSGKFRVLEQLLHGDHLVSILQKSD